MAQKESAHKEAVDSLNDELNQVQRQLDELTVLSRDQVSGHHRHLLNFVSYCRLI